MKNRWLIVGPFLMSVFILGTLALSVHYYRESFLPGPVFSPGHPRLQRPFDLRLPLTELGTAKPGDVVRVEIRKKRNAFFSTAYYAPGSLVLRLPVQITSCGVCIRLSLWDAGSYQVKIQDQQSGTTVGDLPLTVIASFSLYRNDLILLSAILVLSFFSGKTVAPIVRSILPDRLSSPLVHRTLTAAFVFLALGLSSLPLRANPSLDHNPLASSRALHESEGRPEATPALILPPSQETSGILKISHNMDSWTDYGRSLTFFEGPVKNLVSSSSSFLLPDDGRYFLTFWTSDNNQTRQISWVLRANPVSPPFPWTLYAGMVLLSFSGFLAGTYHVRSNSDTLTRTRYQVEHLP